MLARLTSVSKTSYIKRVPNLILHSKIIPKYNNVIKSRSIYHMNMSDTVLNTVTDSRITKIWQYGAIITTIPIFICNMGYYLMGSGHITHNSINPEKTNYYTIKHDLQYCLLKTKVWAIFISCVGIAIKSLAHGAYWFLLPLDLIDRNIYIMYPWMKYSRGRLVEEI